MAHLALEYSAGLARRVEIAMVCQAAHKAILEAQIFPLAGIRIRAHEANHSIVADGLTENDFLAMTMSVGAGRTTEQLREAGNLVFRAVQAELIEPLSTPYFALSLEIRVIDPDLSWKDTPIHLRLSGPTSGKK
jgi:5-carboxymethyl-2-hydroxymuconate isomerase